MQRSDLHPSRVKIMFDVSLRLVFDVEVLTRDTCACLSVPGGSETERDDTLILFIYLFSSFPADRLGVISTETAIPN